MRSDRQTEATKLLDAFDNLSNAPRNYSVPIYGLFPCIVKRMVGMEGNRVHTFYVYLVGTYGKIFMTGKTSEGCYVR